jgi:hypothetical protein
MMREDNATSTVDGNVLAGVLTGILDGDVTSMIGVCGGCGATGPLAETIVEIDERAAIVRCRTCTHTLITVLADREGARLRFGVLRELRRA